MHHPAVEEDTKYLPVNYRKSTFPNVVAINSRYLTQSVNYAPHTNTNDL